MSSYFSRPATEIIRQRYSCRNYRTEPIPTEQQRALLDFMAKMPPSPFGTPARFVLAAASPEETHALRGLGTYGFIRGAPGFIIGATGKASQDMEDFGFQMEAIILFATSLELGTCWLGGTFTRSSFAERIQLGNNETLPTVCSVGMIAASRRGIDNAIRWTIGANNRLGWDALFFEDSLDLPLAPERAGAYATPLEMVRMGPSASNKQPWRIIRSGKRWHFYLRRTAGYRQTLAGRMLQIADLQRVDIGIAMCHFELSATEAGLLGNWTVDEPAIGKNNPSIEYCTTWVEK